MLTLAGNVGVKAYRTESEVADSTPWYVREFPPGSVYACHPDTLHAVLVPEEGTAGRGTAPDVLRRSAQLGHQIVDATCPLVHKVHATAVLPHRSQPISQEVNHGAALIPRGSGPG